MSSAAIILLTLLLLNLPVGVQAGPGGDLSLVNFTPYDWRLNYSHAYQIKWKPPNLISAGSNYKLYIEYTDSRDDGDCGADATFELVGSPVPASFTVQARQTHGKKIQIQYHDQLASLGVAENSLIDLGFDWDGSVLFVLSGDGTTPYISSNPPIGWMQATLSTIGNRTIREISMPLSHDAGMSEVKSSPWFGGVWHNVCTQDAIVQEQLQYGARWFDIRPFNRDGNWLTGHFSTSLGNNHVGGAGRSINDIVDGINSFTSQHPGEFIVLEISHELSYDHAKLYQWKDKFTHSEWMGLYDKLARINELWAPSEDVFNSLPSDLTTVPMSTFIKPGSRSAVIIRIPDGAPPAIGINSNAFIHENRLVWTGSFSDTRDPSNLRKDQLAKLTTDRASRDRPPHRSTWTITQKGTAVTDVAYWKSSIIGLSYLAHRVLLGDLWAHLTKDTYPNLIEIDNFHNSHVTAMCMAINDHYVNYNGPGSEEVGARKMSRGIRTGLSAY
jgi:hypothetical protein